MTHSPSPPFLSGRWWPGFLAGAAAGLLAGVALRRGAEERRRRAAGEAVEGPERWERLRRSWSGAVDGAVEGVRDLGDLLRSEPAVVDCEEIEARVAEMACARECSVRLLGTGIVEVVGRCASDDQARALVEAVSAQPGVEVVVNRVWTPASARPHAEAP